jgi:hypothetical protein
MEFEDINDSLEAPPSKVSRLQEIILKNLWPVQLIMDARQTFIQKPYTKG